MIVRFTKARHEDRPHTFTCVRDDGTTTGMPSTPFFIRHDLTHLAAESILEHRSAFYGLVAQGWDMDSFGEREPGSRKARQLPPEAILTEIIVGTLDLDWAAGPLPAEESAAIIADKNGGAGPTVEQIEQIRGKRKHLIGLWKDLEPGETLELRFPLSE
jgi:hypothetical protein